MVDKGSVARRTLDFEDYLDILRRNAAWIIGPVFAGLVVSTVVAYLLQDSYVSRAVIRIVPQQISDVLVQNASAQDMTGRVEALRQNILSRTTLTNLITTNGLYKSELKSEPMEDVVDKMRAAIGIIPGVGISGPQNKGSLLVQITFKYRDRLMANKICADLVSRFLSSSSAGTQTSQQQANEFLKGEAAKAKAILDDAEQKLAVYRNQHAGALPEEMQGNFAQMTAMQQRLNSLNDAQTRASERRLFIESSLRSAKERVAALRQMTPTSQARIERNSELDKRISDLETSIAAMKERYTSEMPELQTAQENLAVLKRQRDETNKTPAPKSSDSDNPLLARERLDAQAQVDQLEAQLKAVSIEEQQTSRALLSANSQLGAIQGRLASSPAGEKEYSDLLQARESARLKWVDADAKAHKGEISVDMESAKQGETLEMVDDASVPVDPTEPKRPLIIPIGAVAGLFIGMILVAIREVRDTSLKNLKDARVYTQLAVLGSIPLLENDVVIQRRRQVALVSWAIATVVGIAIIAGSVAHYYISKV
jgi:uncharacterized protein involved in exopolysaccharide biosynthesis